MTYFLMTKCVHVLAGLMSNDVVNSRLVHSFNLLILSIVYEHDNLKTSVH